MKKDKKINWMQLNDAKYKARVARQAVIILTITSRKKWLPDSFAERLEWLRNFNEELPNFQTAFGIIGATMTSVDNDYKMYKWINETTEDWEEKWHEYVAYRNYLNEGAPAGVSLGALPAALTLAAAPTLVQAGIFRRITALVVTIKANKEQYNTVVGTALGIIGAETSFEETELVPEFKARQVPGSNVEVAIKATMNGMKYFNLYIDRTTNGVGSPQFVYLKQINSAKYVDSFSLPDGANLAKIGYQIRYVLGNNETGEFAAEWVVVKRNG